MAGPAFLFFGHIRSVIQRENTFYIPRLYELHTASKSLLLLLLLLLHLSESLVRMQIPNHWYKFNLWSPPRIWNGRCGMMWAARSCEQSIIPASQNSLAGNNYDAQAVMEELLLCLIGHELGDYLRIPRKHIRSSASPLTLRCLANKM